MKTLATFLLISLLVGCVTIPFTIKPRDLSDHFQQLIRYVGVVNGHIFEGKLPESLQAIN
ncbi:hypothetical protein [Spirosoma endbachense]|uniref:Uncharacterized protein n=1 Tax=Spirosoma endbachense TaxID=2666025 RepID=A0A6P1VYJ2_9BACT|nr:hypothetical protein [Spirosoma endbachense]QHV97162.1 hypothetical protein GJR95_20075 [Spirosoma endbachense]